MWIDLWFNRKKLVDNPSYDDYTVLKNKLKELNNRLDELDNVLGGLPNKIYSVTQGIKVVLSKKENKTAKKSGMNYTEAMLLCRSGSDVALDKYITWNDGNLHRVPLVITLDLESGKCIEKGSIPYQHGFYNPTDEELQSREWYEI